ncbi:MAG: nitroreductase family protein [bacterium]
MDSKKPDYPINSIILKRWSPRAMSGESITKNDLMTLFEAARWAPSSYNNQPWKFIYAMRETPEWNTIFNLLVEFNQNWCKNAAILIVIISKNNFDYNNKNSRTHSFDTGAAWENLALQATHMNLVSHGIEGFDYDRAKKELGIPNDFTVEAMCAIGKPGKKENLSADLQKKEIPSGRKSISEFVFNGKFQNNIK